MFSKTVVFIACVLSACLLRAQEPQYTPKKFVTKDDPKLFVRKRPAEDGFGRTYLVTSQQVWDVDDNNTTYIQFGGTTVVCVEGQYRKGKREGVFKGYLIDSADHNKKYRIWEQTFIGDKLNGEWRTYGLHGLLVMVQTYKNDSLNGFTRNYWIDGRSLMEEREYFGTASKYILRTFSGSGGLTQEASFENDVPNGPAKRFYPSGVLMDEMTFKNGIPNGVRRYYYPSGKIWIEQEMKNGKPWTVVANYSEDGKRRDAGTLKGGNGTVIFYEQDGKVREVVNYKNGEQVKD